MTDLLDSLEVSGLNRSEEAQLIKEFETYANETAEMLSWLGWTDTRSCERKCGFDVSGNIPPLFDLTDFACRNSAIYLYGRSSTRRVNIKVVFMRMIRIRLRK